MLKLKGHKMKNAVLLIVVLLTVQPLAARSFSTGDWVVDITEWEIPNIRLDNVEAGTVIVYLIRGTHDGCPTIKMQTFDWPLVFQTTGPDLMITLANLVVQFKSCRTFIPPPYENAIFLDSFESGGLAMWGNVVGIEE